ncbi:hypothetical protein COU62_01790 [Candidatus Pacearchaeota archaeon CG10_big_fil_rev_8_21_14_0_10_35_219]|nr:hypothetical protein [Candidatus Pacearchaeota archaeon]OIO42557.1 MAG: hypothetical protein AUJ63_02640 [Candidatus Pacearchaeota archaeon CG1_02_35_32]PIO07924.1 MAG: hypothetical protein COU62_01790 [Candidatus Pacearchaeota archaeon CG10_big_fil_rev_8_21_14_0_10_35_219]PIY81440.1 MAG: hypothetical protein COY79_02650 [Candidatus Pacearchaeota archaeon CG_4_10_14_0_8_um_filter_35_169]PIZ80652.1 MAG: hypothetical protein COY00_00815 [Candidatus Pacearchaeota archaeon CG_4_10_14_0_2_um_filt
MRVKIFDFEAQRPLELKTTVIVYVKKFNRETNPKDPFYGQMQLMKIRRHGNLHVAKLSFDLNEEASIGELSLVLKR